MKHAKCAWSGGGSPMHESRQPQFLSNGKVCDRLCAMCRYCSTKKRSSSHNRSHANPSGVEGTVTTCLKLWQRKLADFQFKGAIERGEFWGVVSR